MKEIQIVLNKPHEGQQQVLSEKKRFNVLCCGRRWGKSKLAINLLSETAIGGKPAAYFTPTYKLLEGTFKEALAILHPIVKRSHQNQTIELITGGVIDFWSMENPFAGRSRKYKRAIVDEGAFAKDLFNSWNEAIRPTLTDLKGDAWFMSTPKGKNDFYKLYVRGVNRDGEWMSWKMSTYTNPYIDKNELEDARKDLPELAFTQEYLAEFNDNIANPFGYNYIQDNIKGLSSGAVKCFGIDLAKSSDFTCIIGLDGNGETAYFERFQRDWGSTKSHIINTIKNIPTLIDSTGVGDSIVEDLQRSRANITGFKFTAQSKQQLMEGLANSIQQGKIKYPDGIIAEELKSFEYEFTRSGVKYSAPNGMHDDTVCALALANFHLRRGTYSGMIIA